MEYRELGKTGIRSERGSLAGRLAHRRARTRDEIRGLRACDSFRLLSAYRPMFPTSQASARLA